MFIHWFIHSVNNYWALCATCWPHHWDTAGKSLPSPSLPSSWGDRLQGSKQMRWFPLVVHAMRRHSRACWGGGRCRGAALGREGGWLCEAVALIKILLWTAFCICFLPWNYSLESTHRSGWKSMNICVSPDVYCQHIFQNHWYKLWGPQPSGRAHQLPCSCVGCGTLHILGEQSSPEGLNE